MEYSNDLIKKVLDNGKPGFYRIAPSLHHIAQIEKIGNEPARLPTLTGTRVTQDDFLRELSPSGHKIFCKQVYPDKITVSSFDENGEPEEYSIEQIARVAFAFQRVIATKQKNHLTGNNLKFTLTNREPTEEINNLFIELKQQWIDKNMDIAFAECVESQLTTGDCALYFFRENKKLDWETFSYTKGDVLIPRYNSVNRLERLYRYYITETEEGEAVEAMMIIDDKEVVELRKGKEGRKQVWVQASKKPHGFNRIPIVYKRGRVAWDDVQVLIEEFEWNFSCFCESNSYFAFPILFTSGNVESLPRKGLQGKTLQGDQDAKANFIQKGGDMDSFKYQIETMLNMIFMGSFTVNITPDTVKSSGDMPGSAIRLVMHPEIDKAIEHAKEWDDFIDQMKELFNEGIGIEMSSTLKVQELKYRIEADVYVPENSQEVINMLNQSVTMGTLSHETAQEHNKFARSDENKRWKKEQEETAKLKETSTEVIKTEDGTEINKENLKQELSNQ